MSNAKFLDGLQLALSKHMWRRHSCTVIFADTNADAPPKPYATLKVSFVKPETFNERYDKVYYEEGNEEGLPKGWHKVRMVYENIRISVTVYDKGSMTGVNLGAYELANSIQDWFSVYAELFFEEHNAVLTAIGEPADRTVHLVDIYDYKIGFDVDIRRTRKKYNVPHYQDGASTDYNYDIINTVIVTNERTGEEITTKLGGGDKRA